MNLKFILALLFLIFGSLGFAGWYGSGSHDHDGNSGGTNGGSTYRGAPGPIVGAGLPVLAIGYGVYLLVRRRRNKT